MRNTQILWLVLTFAGGSTALAQADNENGARLFAIYCSTCHGEEGRGDGGMGSVLKILPADLTQLSAQNAGVFPTTRVVRQIDGRDPLLAHGGVMPLYGMFFEGTDASMRSEAGQPIITSQQIVDLTSHLMAIQE